jgi:ATP-dependent Clp protease ATP-binding subunit ClpA
VSRFDKFLAEILDQAGHEARAEGSSTVEAQHVLLAIAASEEPSTRELLALVGLNHGAVRTALDREFEQSLSAAGVSVDLADLPRSTHSGDRSAALGSSVKLAIERAMGSVTRKQNARPAHLLLGIVQAPVGTVPRALAQAGVDRAALVQQIQQSLAADR